MQCSVKSEHWAVHREEWALSSAQWRVNSVKWAIYLRADWRRLVPGSELSPRWLLHPIGSQGRLSRLLRQAHNAVFQGLVQCAVAKCIVLKFTVVKYTAVKCKLLKWSGEVYIALVESIVVNCTIMKFTVVQCTVSSASGAACIVQCVVYYTVCSVKCAMSSMQSVQ